MVDSMRSLMPWISAWAGVCRLPAWASGSRRRHSWRCLATKSSTPSATAAQDCDEDATPLLVPFSVSPAAARTELLRWQRQSWLAPWNVLAEGTWRLRSAYLPFWSFRGSATVHWTANVTSGGGFTSCQHWSGSSPVSFGPWEPSSLIYASYRYRRDYVAALPHLGWERQLRREPWAAACEPGRLPGLSPEADPPDMKQAIAWELAVQAMTEDQSRRGREELSARLEPGSSVAHIHARLSFRERSAQLVFLPVHAIAYAWGETFNVHSERVPDTYMALVSGGGGPVHVAGQRHYSRVRCCGLAAAATALGGSLASWASGSSAPGLWPLTLEGTFCWGVAGAVAGVMSRLGPAQAERMAEDQRMREEEGDLDRALGYGIGPMAAGSDEQEALLTATEWRRWESYDRRRWEEHKRRAWAEDLWLAQARRRRERRELASRMAAADARAAADEERERRRSMKYGPSSRHNRMHSQRPHFSGGHRAGGRSDFLGYYAALDLQLSGGPVTTDEIRRAFRRAALRSHPDHQAHQQQQQGRTLSNKEARERFHRVRAAYEVLRDPQKRAQYDAGQRPDE
uniref:J domain-containing protein n=1 Tax=Auxenochlorella protothecoides TaxID=3075 RepID=A0A1D2A7J9_AUXPR